MSLEVRETALKCIIQEHPLRKQFPVVQRMDTSKQSRLQPLLKCTSTIQTPGFLLNPHTPKSHIQSPREAAGGAILWSTQAVWNRHGEAEGNEQITGFTGFLINSQLGVCQVGF